MNHVLKRTKILATIGPAVMGEDMIEQLILSGVNACRLNFSHGNNSEREEQLRRIRAAAEKKGRAVAVVADLQGPKIRLGEVKNNRFEVHAGDELILDSAVSEHSDNTLPVGFNLASKVQPGEPLSFFDGKIKASVSEILSDTAIKVKIENDGILMSKKGINLPDTDLGGDILTEKDLADLDWTILHDFDYVAISFVQSASDVERVREILRSKDSPLKIIAKIETKRAVSSLENLEAIVRASDAIMVARGDMAVEAGAEVVPIVQRRLVALCRRYSRLCIVATQMLGSMVESPEPSRAEVSDVANAVIQGADAVMLSDETANGQYPLESVEVMQKIILTTAASVPVSPMLVDDSSAPASYDAISFAVARLAEKLDADLIVSETASGATSLAVAAERPAVPILSLTSNARVANQLALAFFTSSFLRPYSEDYGVDLVRELKNSGVLAPKDGSPDLLAIIISGSKSRASGTDTIKIRHI